MSTLRTAAANAARRRNPEGHVKKNFQVVAAPEVIEEFEQLDPRQRGELLAAAKAHPIWERTFAGFHLTVKRR